MLRYLFRRLQEEAGAEGGAAGDPPAGDPPAGDQPPGDSGKDTLLGQAGKPGDPPPGGPVEWSWQENVKGEGTVPPWFKHEKYKSIAEQAQAAVALETKLGPAAELIGAPEGDYALPAVPEGIVGEWDTEDKMLQTFSKTAKDLGLSQKAYDTIVQSMGLLLAEEQAAGEASIADSLSKLGTNAAARIEAVNNYLATALGPELTASLDAAIGTDVNAYIALEQLVGKASGDAQLSSLPGKQGPGFTKADIEAERYKVYPDGHNLAGKVMYETDAAHRAKVDGMYKELFPGEDRTEVH